MENKGEKKSASYYDWEQSFKKNRSENDILNDDNEKSSSLGIPAKELKTFLESWKEKNL